MRMESLLQWVMFIVDLGLDEAEDKSVGPFLDDALWWTFWEDYIKTEATKAFHLAAIQWNAEQWAEVNSQ